MARQPESLSLDAGLIRKGEARGLHPAVATPAPETVQPAPPPAAPLAQSHEAPTELSSPTAAPQRTVPARVPEDDVDEPPLRPLPPSDEPMRFTSFRVPVSLDEQLRGMIFETRRSKQDILTEFLRQGLERYRKERKRR
jgi:hypothetical protein